MPHDDLDHLLGEGKQPAKAEAAKKGIKAGRRAQIQNTKKDLMAISGNSNLVFSPFGGRSAKARLSTVSSAVSEANPVTMM
jgi:hypothetical protein